MIPILTFLFPELITHLLETITYVSDDKKVWPEILTELFIPQHRIVQNKDHLVKWQIQQVTFASVQNSFQHPPFIPVDLPTILIS